MKARTDLEEREEREHLEKRKRADKQVRERIASMTDMPSELRDAFAQHSPAFVEEGGGPLEGYWGGDTVEHYKGPRGWFIRNDDLDLLAKMSSTAGAIVGFVTVAGATPLAPIVLGGIAVIIIARRVRAKGTYLPDSECKVLMVLKALGPMSADAVAEVLNRDESDPIEWTEGLVTKELEHLEKVRLGDGTYESFAGKGHDDAWSAAGV